MRQDFYPGDRVCYSKGFLQSMGKDAWSMSTGRGKILGFEHLGPDTTLAIIEWENGADLPDMVSTRNLAHADQATGILDD